MNTNHDIELLAGQDWHAPAKPQITDTDRLAWLCGQGKMELASLRETLDREIEGADMQARRVAFRERIEAFMRPQAEIVRRAVPPELSENTHEAPHYADLLDKKGGA